jgi:CelD/BcsL family acetyltransferase involved in cellulose biosynthesis
VTTGLAVSAEPGAAAPVTLVELDLDDPGWWAFVRSRPEAGPFHHPEWARLLADCYGYRGFALALVRGNAIEAGLPLLDVRRPSRRHDWISLPYTDACVPLGDEHEVRDLLPRIERSASESGVRRFEVRESLAQGERGQTAYSHLLRLDADLDTVFKRFAKKQVQQPIRKAESQGTLQIRRAQNAADLVETFYGLHLQTRRRLGVPVQPRRFFRLVWERLLERDLGYVLLAYAGDEPVAGAVFLSWNGAVTYKYSASDPDWWRARPNNLLLWNAIRIAVDAGARSFDFGRTDAGNDGLRKFKRGWGTEERELAYTCLLGTPSAAADDASGLASPLIRRSPALVCRLAGELLYRYAA